nr:hypothetical protein Iba_chr08bCG6560 [Ipomoea batatas]GMD25019.1 hypothetical protein Iba_chr08cCG6130 [Ipomoea batatas]
MVKPRVGGAGEGKGNDDKGKGKMVSPSDTSKDIPLLLKKIEMLEAALYKALVEIEPWSRDLINLSFRNSISSSAFQCDSSNNSYFFNRSGISLEVSDGDTIFPLPLSSLPLPSPAPLALGLTILLRRDYLRCICEDRKIPSKQNG